MTLVGVGLAFLVGVAVGASEADCESAEVIEDPLDSSKQIKKINANKVRTRRVCVLVFASKWKNKIPAADAKSRAVNSRCFLVQIRFVARE